MEDSGYKKYTDEARRGIKGEAYFESLIVGHAIPHRIGRQNDLGIRANANCTLNGQYAV